MEKKLKVKWTKVRVSKLGTYFNSGTDEVLSQVSTQGSTHEDWHAEFLLVCQVSTQVSTHRSTQGLRHRNYRT